ncbi:hypothetical protein [Holospora undulata]|uniref:Uncharacterized protein n=1 Tax=Holospora undulata HU1 TaxID=1321371 RepID=A0A061JGD5_9PROT|nr:hypothetical protein [Holospora undulata]ETZ05081.1 hypothetical protein K737_300495 [Holospora undulata HU1]
MLIDWFQELSDCSPLGNHQIFLSNFISSNEMVRFKELLKSKYDRFFSYNRYNSLNQHSYDLIMNNAIFLQTIGDNAFVTGIYQKYNEWLRNSTAPDDDSETVLDGNSDNYDDFDDSETEMY